MRVDNKEREGGGKAVARPPALAPTGLFAFPYVTSTGDISGVKGYLSAALLWDDPVLSQFCVAGTHIRLRPLREWRLAAGQDVVEHLLATSSLIDEGFAQLLRRK